jgi:hypothetical protein
MEGAGTGRPLLSPGSKRDLHVAASEQPATPALRDGLGPAIAGRLDSRRPPDGDRRARSMGREGFEPSTLGLRVRSHQIQRDAARCI